MSDEAKIVWSDEAGGDLRKKKTKSASETTEVDEAELCLLLRRLTSGKGRPVVEIKGLPNHKSWCKKLAKDLKKQLGVGGAYKDDFIEVHGEKMDQVMDILDKKKIKYKKTGG